MRTKTERRKLRAKVAPSDPEWERMKAARRNLDHDDAVQESAFLQRQFYALWGDRVPNSPVDLNVILRTLTEKKIRFVLTGAHGIGGWTGALVRALAQRFRDLEQQVRDSGMRRG